MLERKLTITDIPVSSRSKVTGNIVIGGTRIALGVGIGLLISRDLNNDQRKAAGVALALVGGLTTISLAIVFLPSTREGQGSGSKSTQAGCVAEGVHPVGVREVRSCHAYGGLGRV